MSGIAARIFSRAGAGVLGLLVLATLVWFAGPYIGIGSLRPLESYLARLILIVIIFAVWGIVWYVKRRAAKKADENLAEDLVGSASADGGALDQSHEEVQQLKQRFEDAISTLRDSSGGKKRVNLYELPWFVIIGPPGSGKTTALVNSGLEFPLEQRFGKGALRGVGGTRNCDWWFTNEAVLLDTAGRYVTQDSHAEVDRAAWEGFLDLLKKYRKRRPINGVMVAISLSDLLLQTDAERNAQVLAIRQRIQELYKHFGIRFPVYMLFTKCDLVAGFIEFFDDLDQTGRRQVWGTTFKFNERTKGADDDVDSFPAELDLLLERLTERMTWRLSQERDQHRRSKIYNFPQQVIALSGTLSSFLRDVFSSNRYDERILVRGVYFTSGTQEGTPIDRMMSVMARTFGMAEQALPSFGGKGRSYFITDLFRRIIFQESGLAGVNPRIERRRRWMQAIAYGGSIGLAVIAAFAWVTSFNANHGYLDAVGESLGQYEALASGPDSAAKSLDQVLPRLDALRSVLDVAKQHNDSVPWHMRMWLFQGRAVSERVADAYRRELNESLGPTVVQILENRIRENTSSPQLLYEYLKAYMMLGIPDRMDPRQLSFLISSEWRRSYSDDGDRYSRLKKHSDFLFEQAIPYAVNERLISGAQATLAQSSLSEFLYSRLKLDALAYDRDALLLSSRLGLGADKVFLRKSGVSLSEPISPLFTKKGFKELYPTLAAKLIAEAGNENWILGRDEKGLSVREIAVVESELREKYTADYITTWREILGDMKIVPFSNERQAMEVLDLIAAKPSVMHEFLLVVAENTNLSEPKEEGGGDSESESRLERMFGSNDGGLQNVEVANPADPITRAFSRINSLVTGQPAMIEQILLMVDDLQREVEASSGGVGQSDALRVIVSGGGPAARKIRTAARRQPEPVKSWLASLSGGSQVLAAGNVRSELKSRFRESVQNECQRLIDGRYPFARNSGQNVAIDDFGRMFGYGGVLDKFFEENLAPLVDRSDAVWRLRRGASVSVSEAALRQFALAERIRETYFRSGSQRPELMFTMIPIGLDSTVRRFIFNVNGQSFEYAHGPQRPTSISWPGEATGRARILFEEANGGRATVVEDGPWALFRLLDSSDIRQLSDIEFEVDLSAGGLKATVKIEARSVTNPFSGPRLHEFRCPASL